mmetsp:Transcript_21318/g.52175  ORF Transcript_21318/g.52175 Transcript_21318/m.52175 type:complete len:375 (-) Transcript_21318:307-1431(-)
MGICAGVMDDRPPLTAAQRKADKMLTDKIGQEKRKDAMVHKLLLLGAGESGKSTIFKQMTNIYGGGFSEKDRREFIPIIHSNTIHGIQCLIRASYALAARGKKRDDEALMRCAVEDSKVQALMVELLQFSSLDEPLTKEVNESILTVWKEKGIQKTYEYRGQFSLPDSTEYFFGRLEDTWQNDYVPTLQDVLRSRVRTTGILEQTYDYSDSHFHIFDVGGQRNERKKWIHLFSDVTAVLFIASLSAFDQVLYEDRKINRMEESLNLFEEVCNLRWFSLTNIILFLNKSDLFEEKLKTVELAKYCKEYSGDNDFKSACLFIKDKFLERNKSDRKASQIFTHITNATDTDHVKFVFNACQNIIIHASLNQAGLLMQ